MSWAKVTVGVLSRAATKVREAGFRYAGVLVLQRVVPSRYFSSTRIVVMQLPTERAGIEQPIGRWASPADLPALMQFGHAESVVQKRLQKGDRAWMVFKSGQLIGYCWFTSGRYDDEVSSLEFPARPNGVWLYDAMVSRLHRGRGIYPRLLASAAIRLREEGIASIWIIVETLNRNSVRAHKAGGAAAQEEIRILRLLGRKIVRHSPPS